MPQSSLPSELWMQIASGISIPNDLAHLCVTSSRFLHIVRPYLYRNVKIKVVGPQSNASHVLELLAHDKPLAKCVIELTLERCQPPGQKYVPDDDPQSQPSLINLDALANMVSLKHVTLYGPVFRNAHEQNEFGCVLAPGSNISLEELTYVANNEEEEFPTDRIGDIGGLKKLYWNDRTLNQMGTEPLWHILSRSMTTIHTLSLPFDLCTDNKDNLWKMRFPNLHSFTLGFWQNVDTPAETDFFDFIDAHSNTIEVLDLEYDGYDNYDNYVWMFDDDSWLRFHTDSLPHLHSLRGHPSTLVSLTHSRLQSLSTTLRRLAIGPYCSPDIFKALSSPQIGHGPPVGHLWALQEIELDLTQFFESEWDEVIAIIQQCARSCPSLEVWRGTLPGGFKIDAESLGQLLGLFTSLRMVYLHEENILGYWERAGGGSEDELDEEQEDRQEDEPENQTENEARKTEETEEKPANDTVTKDNTSDDSTIESFVHTIASICGTLQNVSVQRIYPMKDWWTVSRTWNPKVSSQESQVCALSRRTFEERDLERWWTSQTGEKKPFYHWIHMP